MCNFGEAIYEDGIEKGIEEARVNCLRIIMEKMNFNFNQAADFMEIFDVSERLQLERTILAD